MDRALTSADEGKRVVTADGDVIGAVVRIDEGTALVRPRPGLLDGCGSWLSGSWDGTEAFELDHRAIDGVTDESVVVAPAGGEATGSARSENPSAERSTDEGTPTDPI